MIYRIILLVYLMSIVFFTTIQDYKIFFLIFPVLILISIITKPKLIKKAIFSVLPFNLVISVSYSAVSIIKNQLYIDYLILINLRVLSITLLTFLFFSNFNIFKMFNFSRSLTFILVLSYSQINIFKKYYEDFRLAFKSRTIAPPSKKDIYNFISSVLLYFANKSINGSKEITQAMKSRGFFINQ
ncbi:hypothetical protein [Persephonella sp.]